jgi:hypothetical protein
MGAEAELDCTRPGPSRHRTCLDVGIEDVETAGLCVLKLNEAMPI